MINKKMELLAPAGNPNAFDAALNAGADAIYLGVDRFSARRGAANFSIDELEEAVRKAHLRNTKLYVAFNTVIADEELTDAARNLAGIYNAGIDAVIVQDWGVYRFIKEAMPGLAVHASTQMNAHNSEMVRFIERQAAKRVTLARELSVEEIGKICESTNMEVECFIHGALCFSYSGQCLFSSMVGNRSGNRGMCPQACRLEYSLSTLSEKTGDRGKADKSARGSRNSKIKDISAGNEEIRSMQGKHIMSARDLCGIKLIPDLAKAGVSALKIEGRMKSPEYVAAVVSVYRRAIDRYYSDPDRFSVSEDEIGELREAFSRGFTEGYLSGIRDERMMSFERPSDRGVFIGRVTYLDIYKARLGIELKTELHIGDEVEAWVSQGGRIKIKAKDIFVDGKKVEFAPAGSKAAIAVSEKRHKIHSGDRVFRVRSDKLERKAREIIKGSEFRRVPIAMEAEIAIGKPITIVARTIDERNSHKSLEARAKSDFIVEVGERRSLSEADAIAQFERLGNTVYRVDLWNITVEPGAMVSLGKLNELRRAVIDKLDAVRIGTAARQRISVKQATAFLNDAMQTRTKARKKNQNKKPVIAVDVSSFKQAERAAINGADWIYLRPGLSRFDLAGSSAVDLAETVSKLKSAYGVKAALSTGNIIHDKELDIVGSIIKSTGTIFDALLVDNFGIIEMMESIKREKDASLSIPLFVDYHMNIFNRLCAGFFETNTASRICLSTELTLEQTADIVASISSSKSHIESEAIVHGWLEVMTAEHCVPSVSKHSCTVCKTRSFIAEDQKGFKFPIEQDENCRSHIYNSHELYLLPNIRNIINTGVSSLRLMLNRYTPDDAGRATSLYREAVDLIWSGSKNLDTILERAEKVLPGLRQTTTGHYFRAVQ